MIFKNGILTIYNADCIDIMAQYEDNYFDDILITNYESELTTPVFIDGVYGRTKFQYEIGERPGFKCEMVL